MDLIARLRQASFYATPPAKYFSGTIVQPNYDGTYHVLVRELNIVYPFVGRARPDRRVLSAGKAVQLVQEGLALRIL